MLCTRNRDKCSHKGTGTCSFMRLPRDTFGQVGPVAFAFLARVAKVAAGTGAAGRCIVLENAMRDISTTLCRAVARQVCAAAPVQARFAGKAVCRPSYYSDKLVSLAVPTEEPFPLVGHYST